MTPQLAQDGLVVIRSLFSQKQITKFRRRYERLRSNFFQHLPKLKFTDGVAKFKECDVLKLAPGRYDFHHDMDRGLFAQPSFLMPRRIKSVLAGELENDFRCYAGALPSVGKSKNGAWHRDVYPLGDEIAMLELPPFYFTVLIPLVDITEDNGPTEYMLGSHLKRQTQLRTCTKYQAILRVGDVCVANGMTFHRGTANKSGRCCMRCGIADGMTIIRRMRGFSVGNIKSHGRLTGILVSQPSPPPASPPTAHEWSPRLNMHEFPGGHRI